MVVTAMALLMCIHEVNSSLLIKFSDRISDSTPACQFHRARESWVRFPVREFLFAKVLLYADIWMQVGQITPSQMLKLLVA